MGRFSTQVDIDTDDFISEIDTIDLEDELRCRNDRTLPVREEEHLIILENLYYALRDQDIDEAIKVVNPLLDEKLGRQV